MNGMHEFDYSSDFQWSPEYDQLLEKISTSDYVQSDWVKLRDIIKYKINQNLSSYMSDPPSPPPPPSVPVEPPVNSPETVATLSPKTLATGGVKFPPFPRREVNEFVRNEYNSHGRAKTALTEEEAKGLKDGIWRLLHEFDGNPPFTIQRVCELAMHPRVHYKSAGKYLRAVERALLVTSSIDAFPIIPPDDPAAPSMPAHTFSPTGSLREATTPLFSPIPFLHGDARRSRSRSRSPPMSPLQLAATRGLSPGAGEFRLAGAGTASVIEPVVGGDAIAVEGDPIIDGPVIGLVDELDDPSPGHMSDRPTALTATTSTMPDPVAVPAATSAPRKPMFGGSLEERFVRSSLTKEAEGPALSRGSGGGGEPEKVAIPAGTGSDDPEAMAVDEPDADKENVNKG